MADISKVNLITCPDCGRSILDNVNYCRFCGHDFNDVSDESSGRFSKFLKNTFKGIVTDSIRYCTHCKEEIRDSNTEFCPNCSTRVSFNDNFAFCSCGNMTNGENCILCKHYQIKFNPISVEEYNQIWYNEIIVPLSNKYDKDFSKIYLREHFNLTPIQESHIIYRIMYAIKFNEIKDDIIEFVEKIIEETRNYDDIEEAILNNIKLDIISSFYDNGIKYNRTSNIKPSQYKTVETPVIKNKHGTGTKILATAVAGPLGFVATSGIKQENETKQVHVKGEYMHYEYSFNPNHITIKAYSNDSLVNSFDPEKITDNILIKWENIDYLDENNYLFLNTEELVQLRLPVLDDLVIRNIFRVTGTLKAHENKNLKLKYFDKIKEQTPDILIELLKQFINKNKVSKSNIDENNSLINELERLSGMYEKGLLTDDEFAAMKKKLIEGG